MTLLVTGAAGFIGYHLTEALLAEGCDVLGVDSLNSYYDPALKAARLKRLEGRNRFRFQRIDLSEPEAVAALAADNQDITEVIHLAAQAGVRYSLEAPFSYVDANVTGQLSILEAGRLWPRLKHLVYASSSSVYGANSKVPFSVGDRVDDPVSLYAATKRAGELMAGTYARLYGLPLTGLRFFTVYGPWGRPDMAYYHFAKAILEGREIEVFNHGKMRRDFTWIDDVIAGIKGVLAHPPSSDKPPHRIYNIGNNRAETLEHFIQVIEKACRCQAKKLLKPMQPGDVVETYADIEASRRDFGYNPKTTIDEGMPRFVAWLKQYHGL